MTYGTVPASFLATKCLNVLAKEVESKHAEAAKSIAKSFYIDDYLGGHESPEKTVDLLQVIDQILSSAGFSLRKYASNDPLFWKYFSNAKAEEMLKVKCLFNTE